MAFTEKYRIEYKDYFNNSWKVSIYNNGWAGSVTDLTGGSNPFSIHYLADDDDITKTVIGSEATISVINTSDEQFSDIWTGILKDWIVITTKNGSEIWRGYIDTEEYYEPLLYPPYESVFKCFDGIGIIKNTQLNVSHMTKWEGNSLIKYISLILRNALPIGYQLPIWESIDISHDYMINTRILEDTYIDYRSFMKSDDEFESDYDILDAILKGLQCRIFQDSGKWIIERIFYKSNITTVYNIYNFGGVYQSQETLNKQIALTNSTGIPLCVWEGQSQTLEIIPAWKEYTIKNTNEHRRNIMRSNNPLGVFNDDEFDGYGVPLYYTLTGNLSSSHIWGGKTLKIAGGQTGVPFTKYLTTVSERIRRVDHGTALSVPKHPPFIGVRGDVSDSATGNLVFRINIRLKPVRGDATQGKNGKFYFGFNVKMINSTIPGFTDEGFGNTQGSWDPSIVSPIDNIIRVVNSATAKQIYAYQDGYWHNSDRWWDNQNSKTVYASLYFDTRDGFRDYTMETAMINFQFPWVKCSFETRLLLRGHIWDSESISSDVEIESASVQVLGYEEVDNVAIGIVNERIVTETVNEDYNKVPSTIELKFDDYTIRGINKEFNRYNFLIKDGLVYEKTDWWNHAGGGGVDGLIDSVHRVALRSQYNKPRRKLKGDLITDDMTFSNTLVDSCNRIYLPMGFDWDTKNSIRQSEWHELQGQGTITQSGAFDDEAFAPAFDI